MILKALSDNVIVSRLEKNLTSAGGIILRTSDEADKAVVISIGPLVEDFLDCGATVIVNWNKASKVGENTYRLKFEDVIAVVE